MNVTRAVLALFFVTALLLGGCEKPFTEKDNGATVELSLDDPLEIVLSGNPTTGYRWEVAQLDPSVVKAAGSPSYEPGGSAMGAGGSYSFRFVTVGAGQTTLRLICHRPFEKGVPPQKTFELNLVVGTMGRIEQE